MNSRPRMRTMMKPPNWGESAAEPSVRLMDQNQNQRPERSAGSIQRPGPLTSSRRYRFSLPAATHPMTATRTTTAPTRKRPAATTFSSSDNTNIQNRSGSSLQNHQNFYKYWVFHSNPSSCSLDILLTGIRQTHYPSPSDNQQPWVIWREFKLLNKSSETQTKI